MTDEKRPPNDRGQGRKAKSPDGELAKNRAIRMTDSDWADMQLVTLDRVRVFVRKEAAKMRKAVK